MAESLAVLQVCNLALGHVGQPSVVAVSASPECQLYYPHVRDKLLSWSPWTFATTRQDLVRMDVTPPGREYLYQYALPALPFPLRVLTIDTQRFRYAREVYIPPSTPDTQQAVLLTNAPSVTMRYVCRVSESMFSPLFLDTLGLWLGLSITERLTSKRGLRAQLFAELQLQMVRLIDIDGHQDSPPRALNETYIAVREDGTSDSLYPFLDDFEEAL